VIEYVEEYNLDKPVAAASLLNDVARLITMAQQRGGPAKMILAVEPEQGSAMMGGQFTRLSNMISRGREP
jgi:hypothetical protein